MAREPIKWSEMSEDEYLREAESQIWLSAFASNNPRAPAHDECDRAYDEAKRRDAMWLYRRAWNRAYQSCGYTISDEDRRAAMKPTQQEPRND